MSINSVSFNFDQVKLLAQDNVDNLAVTESNIDQSFPTNQFLIDSFAKPYRLDRNGNGGGVLL